MTTTTIPTEITDFAGRVRAALGDLGAEEVDDLTEGLEADDPHLGLIQFKVGTGGQAVEYLGEWDLPLNPLLYKAFDVYMKRR